MEDVEDRLVVQRGKKKNDLWGVSFFIFRSDLGWNTLILHTPAELEAGHLTPDLFRSPIRLRRMRRVSVGDRIQPPHPPHAAKTESLRASQIDPSKMNHNDLIKQVIPILYNYPAGIPRNQWRSSYACKHDVEHLVGTYITNDEFKQAGAEFGLDYRVHGANYGFAVKPRFPMEWLREFDALTKRPHGARISHWNAYLDACKEVKTLKSNIQDAEDHQQEVLAAYNAQNPQDPITLSQ